MVAKSVHDGLCHFETFRTDRRRRISAAVRTNTIGAERKDNLAIGFSRIVCTGNG
jgi:hypothetical protein